MWEALIALLPVLLQAGEYAYGAAKGGQSGGAIAGPPSPGTTPGAGQPGGPAGGLGSILGTLGGSGNSSLSSMLGTFGQNAGNVGQIGNLFKPQSPLQTPPLAQPGPPTPFQSSQVPTTGAGGANPILDLLKKLLGGMQ